MLQSCDSKSRPKVVRCIRKWTDDKKLKMDIELPKARGNEVRYVVKYKVVGDEGTDVPLADLKSRVLKGNPEGILVKSEPVYKDGVKGLNSPVATVIIPSEEVAPLPGKFSVAADRQVYFSKGNLNGWRWEDDWSLAGRQYTMKGNANMGDSGYPADEVDLYAWSTQDNYFGTYYGYGETDENTIARFQGPFAEWGESEGVTLLKGTAGETYTLTISDETPATVTSANR